MNYHRFKALLPAAIKRQKITSHIIWEVIFCIWRNKIFLFRTEDTIAGITETGNDIALIIQGIVEGCNVDADVRMVGIDLLNTLGRGYQAHELDILNPLFFEQPVPVSAGRDKDRYGLL